MTDRRTPLPALTRRVRRALASVVVAAVAALSGFAVAAAHATTDNDAAKTQAPTTQAPTSPSPTGSESGGESGDGSSVSGGNHQQSSDGGSHGS